MVSSGDAGAIIQVRRPNWIIDGFELDLQRVPRFAVTFEAEGPAVDKGTHVGLPFCGSGPDSGAVEVGC